MNKREAIIEILKGIKPSLIDKNGPTSIFITDDKYKRINITNLSIEKERIIVTTGKYLFKRKYKIKKSEI
jgi:hypothetical protein